MKLFVSLYYHLDGIKIGVMETPLLVAYIAAGVSLTTSVFSIATSIFSALKSAKASRDVAELNAHFAKELKEVEFVNTHHTKLLEKRLRIYEEFEESLKPFFNGLRWRSVLLPEVLVDAEAFFQVRKDLKTLQLKARWLDTRTQEDLQVVMSNLHILEKFFLYEEEGRINREQRVMAVLPFTDKLIKHVSGLLDSAHRDLMEMPSKHREKAVYYAPNEVLPQIMAALQEHPLIFDNDQGKDSEEPDTTEDSYNGP